MLFNAHLFLKRFIYAILLFSGSIVAHLAIHAGEELPTVQARPIQIALFSDGTAVVTEELFTSGHQAFAIEWPAARPEFVWFQEEPKVALRWTNRQVSVAMPPRIHNDLSDIQGDFGGRLVTIYFKGSEPMLRTTLFRMPKQTEETGENEDAIPYLIMQEGKSVRFIDPDIISMIQLTATSAEKPFFRQINVLEVTAPKGTPFGEKLHFSYIAEGIKWQADYLLNISSPNKLYFYKRAEITNNWRVFTEVDIELAGSVSPTADTWQGSPQYTWAGVHSMSPGDSLRLPVADAVVRSFDALVLWKIPSNRNADGKLIREVRSHMAWDAIEFANPLQAPLEAGHVRIVANGRLLSVDEIDATYASGKIVLQKSPAARFTTEHTEVVQGSTEAWIDGDPFRMTSVHGKAYIANQSDKAILVRVVRNFRGHLTQAPGYKTIVNKSLHDGEINPLRQVVWEYLSQPGESREFEYDYEVAIRQERAKAAIP